MKSNHTHTMQLKYKAAVRKPAPRILQTGQKAPAGMVVKSFRMRMAIPKCVARKAPKRAGTKKKAPKRAGTKKKAATKKTSKNVTVRKPRKKAVASAPARSAESIAADTALYWASRS